MLLDNPHKIIKEVIERVTRDGEELTTHKHKPTTVKKMIGCHQNERMCSLKDIKEEVVQLLLRVITHTFCKSS